MSLQNENKLMKMLDGWLPHTLATSPWLNSLGISRQLARKYQGSGWIEPAGHGAFKRANETITWQGALHTLQQQLKLSVHLGGMTAISLSGAAHYLRMGKETIFLFSPPEVRLPKWFSFYQKDHHIEHIKTSFLARDCGTKVYSHEGLDIKISSQERAILECLYLSPKNADLLECYQIIEGLTTIRPKLVQELLEGCTSVKVKRLFLYMAEKAKLPVIKHLELEKIDLGKGDRTIYKGGVYNNKYKLTLPRELVQDV